MNIIHPNTPLKILLAVDSSPCSAAAVTWLTCITWPARTSVHLLAVVPERLPLLDTQPEARSQVDEATEIVRWRDWAGTKLLAGEVAGKLQAHHLAVETEIEEGNLATVLLGRAASLSVDLIVIGAKQPGTPDQAWLDPVADELACYARCAVLVVRPEKLARPLSTIVTVDGSSNSWQTVKFLSALSPADWARITLISLAAERTSVPTGPELAAYHQPIAAPPRSRLPELHAATAYARKVVNYLHDCGVQVRWDCRCGPAADEVLSAVQDQQAVLVVVGADCGHTQRGDNLARKLVRYAPCSVLIVR